MVSFAARGIDGTSLREVAEAAGVSLATIHYYFGNKAELYEACLGEMTAELEQAARPFGERMRELHDLLSGSPRDEAALRKLIDRTVRETFRFGCEHRNALRVLMRPVLESGELDPRWREGILLPFVRNTASSLGSLLGRPAAELRLALQSLIVLGVRYALSSPAELTRLAHVSGEARARRAVEDHLVEIAEILLWGRGP